MFQGNINREFRELANLYSLPCCNWFCAYASSLSLERTSHTTLVPHFHVHHNGDVPTPYPRRRNSKPPVRVTPARIRRTSAHELDSLTLRLAQPDSAPYARASCQQTFAQQSKHRVGRGIWSARTVRLQHPCGAVTRCAFSLGDNSVRSGHPKWGLPGVQGLRIPFSKCFVAPGRTKHEVCITPYRAARAFTGACVPHFDVLLIRFRGPIGSSRHRRWRRQDRGTVGRHGCGPPREVVGWLGKS